MYRRIAFAAADLSLAVGGLLLVWGLVRLHDDVQRLYGVLLGFAVLLVGGVQLAGAMNVPAAAGQTVWRRLRPRWPVQFRRVNGYLHLPALRAALEATIATVAPSKEDAAA
jgi:hypothetical protein